MGAAVGIRIRQAHLQGLSGRAQWPRTPSIARIAAIVSSHRPSCRLSSSAASRTASRSSAHCFSAATRAAFSSSRFDASLCSTFVSTAAFFRASESDGSAIAPSTAPIDAGDEVRAAAFVRSAGRSVTACAAEGPGAPPRPPRPLRPPRPPRPARPAAVVGARKTGSGTFAAFSASCSAIL